MRRVRSIVWLAASLGLPGVPALAEGADARGLAFFEQKIRPVLVKECYSCHAAGAKSIKAGLRLDSREAMLKGGDSGPVLTPGQPDESLLLDALRHDGVEMPPTGKLPETVVADFAAWVKMGAPDPRVENAPETNSAAKGIDVAAGRSFWSFQLPKEHAVPTVSRGDWPLNDVDRFLLAAMEAKGVRPAPEADRRALLRRLAIDLTGLPPTPEDADAFLDDSAPEAFERAVDRFLASPRFGERWGRHWLDLARYADSNGKDENLTFHEAYKYRNYVIDAFNHDKPYDQFIREQVAGDLLPAEDQAARDERLIATGFLIVGPKVLADRDQVKRQIDVVDEQVDTIGRVMLGMTLGCARCHDHKFDPVPTRDYYALAGILNSTHTLDGFKLGNPVVAGWTLRPLGPDGEAKFKVRQAYEKKAAELTKQITKAKADVTALEKKAKEAKVEDPAAARKLAEAKEKLASLIATEKAEKAKAPEAPPLALAARDEEKPADMPTHIRGNPHNPGKTVPRGFLSVASREPRPKISEGQSGRKELAEWLSDPSNPLTARVMVNRVWMHLFGEGLVRSVDNFGGQGERPSHPELLDTLAVRFMNGGWSVKSLVRTLATSRAYRLAVEPAEGVADLDPENRLLSHAFRRRLEAEVIRDTMLLVSGRLESGRGGGSPVGMLGERAVDNNSKGGVPTDANPLRSVYLPVIRNDLPAVFEVFDFADPEVSTGRREATTVATQALFLMNSPFVMEQSRAAAARLLALPGDDDARLDDLYRRALARPPLSDEAAAARRFLDNARARGEPAQDAWAAVCQAVFGCTEFRFVE